MKYKSLIVLLLAASPVLADDMYPFGFDKEPVVSTKTRAQVQAELKAAQAAGEPLGGGEAGFRFINAPSTKSRAQVLAEMREASRLGLLNSFGEAGPPITTPAQEEQIRQAGVRALQEPALAGR